MVGRSNLGLVTFYELVEWLGVCLAHLTHPETILNKFPWRAAPKQPSWTQINFHIFWLLYWDGQRTHIPPTNPNISFLLGGWGRNSFHSSVSFISVIRFSGLFVVVFHLLDAILFYLGSPNLSHRILALARARLIRRNDRVLSPLQVLFYLREYVIVNRLLDPDNPRLVSLKGDPLACILGRLSFAIDDIE